MQMISEDHDFHEIIFCLKEIVQVLKGNPGHVLKEVKRIGQSIDSFVPYHDGHSLRVSEYALTIMKALKFNKRESVLVEVSALLHDIGKVGFAKEILTKPQKLSRMEKIEIERHSLRGYFTLAAYTDIPQILDGVKSHHESWDGSGYPQGLKATNIPLIGRILAVADAYDAMRSDRPYRKAYSKKKAIAELKKFTGIQFDANLVRVFLKVIDKLS